MMPICVAVLADHHNILDRRPALTFADRIQVMDVKAMQGEVAAVGTHRAMCL